MCTVALLLGMLALWRPIILVGSYIADQIAPRECGQGVPQPFKYSARWDEAVQVT